MWSRIFISIFSIVWCKRLSYKQWFPYKKGRNAKVIIVRGWKSALIESPTGERLGTTWILFYDIRRWIRFKWIPIRVKLHYIGWHTNHQHGCKKYRSYPVREHQPHCEITGKYVKPSKWQLECQRKVKELRGF